MGLYLSSYPKKFAHFLHRKASSSWNFAWLRSLKIPALVYYAPFDKRESNDSENGNNLVWSTHS